MRTCLVSKQAMPRDSMLRFALSPDGMITPDVLEKLPGRGLWIAADAKTLSAAIEQDCFRKAARRFYTKKIDMPEDLPAMIDKILARRLCDLISLLRRSGHAICGFERIKSSLPAERGMLDRGQILVQASDGSPAQLKKIGTPTDTSRHITCLTGNELGLAFGRDCVIHALLSHHGLNKKIYKDAARLAALRGDTHACETTGETNE